MKVDFCSSEENACKQHYHLAYSSTMAAAVRTLWNCFYRTRLIALGDYCHVPSSQMPRCYIRVDRSPGETRGGSEWFLSVCLVQTKCFFLLRLKGNNFGAGEKLVGSTICRLLTRACALQRWSLSEALAGKRKDNRHLEEMQNQAGCAGRGWVMWGYQRVFASSSSAVPAAGGEPTVVAQPCLTGGCRQHNAVPRLCCLEVEVRIVPGICVNTQA